MHEPGDDIGPDGLTAAELQQARAAWWTDASTATLRRKRNPVEEQVILDVGCGTGALWQHLRPQPPASLISLDIELTRLLHLPRSLVGDALSLPFRSHVFSAATAILTLQHLPDQGAVLAEMPRVVHSDGLILAVEADNRAQRLYVHIDTPVLEDAYELFWRKVAAVRRQTDFRLGPRLLALLHKSGLLSAQIEGVLATNCQHTDASAYFRQMRQRVRALAARHGVENAPESHELSAALEKAEALCASDPDFYVITTVPMFIATARTG
jgi:SAM-dependent methyltransferase